MCMRAREREREIISGLSPYLHVFFGETCEVLGLCSAEWYIVSTVDGPCSAHFQGFSGAWQETEILTQGCTYRFWGWKPSEIVPGLYAVEELLYC